MNDQNLNNENFNDEELDTQGAEQEEADSAEQEKEPMAEQGGDFGTAFVKKKARKVSKKKVLKIALISFTAFLLVIACLGAALVIPLIQAYNRGYTKVPIVSGPGSYEIPTLIIDTNLPDTVEPETLGPGETASPETEEPEVPETEYIPPNPIISTGISKVDQIDSDVINILLVGTNSRSLTSLSGRSDSMIVCSLNKRTGDIKLISLMRDTLVPIAGIGENGSTKWNRLNATFAYGGVSLCINTVNWLFGLDIQKFVIVNFDGAKNLVNACGGVDLALTDEGANNEVDYILSMGNTVTKNDDGTYHLDGAAALTHMRQRKGSSDFKRTERQRKVITAVFNQVMASKSPTQIYNLVEECFNMIKTNITLSEMMELASYVISNGGGTSIGSHRLPTKYSSIYFNFNLQKQVQKGQVDENGNKILASSVLWIDLDYEKNQILKTIYGKK